MTATPRRILALTVVLTVIFVATALTTNDIGGEHPAWDVLLLALCSVPVAGIGRNPLLALLTVSLGYPLWILAGHDGHVFHSLPALVCIYAVGAWDRPLRLRATGLLAPVWMLGGSLAGLWNTGGIQDIWYIAVIFVLGWGLGAAMASRDAYARQLEARTAALQQARRELADRAVADERARIARELHDVIAHAMSVITVRAGVGRYLIETRPAEAAEALGVIEHTGRQALSEMRRMLAVLRAPGPRRPAPQPQPGLADLPDLVEQAGQAGVTVMLAVDGPVRCLPPGLDLAAYRVIQEALTNTVKHGTGGRATLVIRYRPDRVETEIRNPCRAPAGPVDPGHGLRGMAERVALYDGRLETGMIDEGQFRVFARFPNEAET
ncbi:MAG: sensor histidine kinase [Dactylosporangium sp.]|nr:hypothetical protein [Dactylosporangium sp.]NNJ62043.1 sensor histidine kinase [Dactylosporangium sp.]